MICISGGLPGDTAGQANMNVQKEKLIGQMVEGSVTFPTLGFLVWWNIRGVEISRDELVDMLKDCDLDTKYARMHNYRSSFIRALKAMEEKRIIRKVEEDHTRIIYQFTNEIKIEDSDDPRLVYSPETTVIVDKCVYTKTEDFASAITQCDEQIKPVLVELFLKERELYRSADITRYIQNIFNDNADIVSLREQGSVYFIPFVYSPILEKVTKLVKAIGCVLEFMPVPDVKSSRDLISHAFVTEVTEMLESLQEDVTKASGKTHEVTNRWVAHRVAKLTKIKKRINLYAEADKLTFKDLKSTCDALASTLTAVAGL